jgi:hypothetical protein
MSERPLKVLSISHTVHSLGSGRLRYEALAKTGAGRVGGDRQPARRGDRHRRASGNRQRRSKVLEGESA